MNPNYISHALCFHGQPLQKIWDDERGVEDLRKMRIQQPSYAIYQERQKYFTFQERAKRLKLHQFLARKAEDLYDRSLVGNVMEEPLLAEGRKHIVNVPPFECYMNNVKDKRKWWQYRLNCIKPGDIIYATVTKTLAFGPHRMQVKPLCTSEPNSRYLADVPIKASVIDDTPGAQTANKRNNIRAFNPNDYLRCEVHEISVDAERMILGLSGVLTKSPLKLGLVELQDIPEFFRETMNLESKNYEEQLVQSTEFDNPNYEALYLMNGLNINDNFSLLSTLKHDFPREEYAKELRIRQASTWAFHYVAEGIERFKNGQQVEAFQCLNQALNIDPRNVEGLVARGALYANKGSFLKAIEDFEKALKLNSFHVNARKYMGETLVALGHSFEEEQRLPEAIKAYTDCLNLIPNHEQARISLDALQRPSVSLSAADGFRNHTQKPEVSSSESETESDSRTSTEMRRKRQPSSKEDIRHSQAFSHPFYAMDVDKKALSSSKNVNEFKLEDDETVSQVRKLLRAASKHKKSKKKSEKDRKKNKKSKKESDLDALDYMQKLDFDGAYRMMSSGTNMNVGQLQENLQIYERSIAELRNRQEKDASPNTFFGADNNFNAHQVGRRSDNPASLSMHYDKSAGPSSHARDNSRETSSSHATLPSTNSTDSNKLSFQIKRPVRVDKFGLVRAATPLADQPNASPSTTTTNASGSNRLSFQIKNPVKMDKFGLMRVGSPLGDYPSPSSSRSQSRTQRSKELASTRRQDSSSRSRSRSRSQRRNNVLTSTRRSRSWTPERFRGHNRHNYKRNRSPYHDRESRSRSTERYRRYNNNKNSSHYRRTSRDRDRSPQHRRRTPSPFVPRGTPSPRSRFRRSRTPNSVERIRPRRRSRSPRRFYRGGFNSRQHRRGYANRVWQRRKSHDHYLSGADDNHSSNDSNDDNRPWDDDDDHQTNEDQSKQKNNEGKTNRNEQTVEEIDEIINKAQKERKQEIIKRDKDILKKTPGSSD